MSPQQTTAQTQAIRLAAQHVDNAAQAISIIANQVQQASDATLSGYVTQGAVTFRGVVEQWGSDMRDIIGDLRWIQEHLLHTSLSYNATINADQDSANQLAALLNGTDV